MSSTGSLLVVVYTYREPDIIRVISAWKANRPQRLRYIGDKQESHEYLEAGGLVLTVNNRMHTDRLTENLMIS